MVRSARGAGQRADLDLKMFPGVGHFPHREDPERAAQEIAGFFDRVWR